MAPCRFDVMRGRTGTPTLANSADNEVALAPFEARDEETDEAAETEDGPRCFIFLELPFILINSSVQTCSSSTASSPSSTPPWLSCPPPTMWGNDLCIVHAIWYLGFPRFAKAAMDEFLNIIPFLIININPRYLYGTTTCLPINYYDMCLTSDHNIIYWLSILSKH